MWFLKFVISRRVGRILAFIIVDLEFNNLSGIHKYIPNVYNDYPNLKKLDLVNEIIEIGAVKLDAHMQPCE